MATTELRFEGPRERAPHARSSAVEWLSTVDHKKIGILYVVTAVTFFCIGGVLALFIRAQLTTPSGAVMGDNTFNQVFTMHGTIMIYLFSVPIFTGLGNYFMPLQIGAADVAFPRLNALSYWLYLFGGIAAVSGFFTANGPAANGWTSYVPLALERYSQGAGTDLWIIGLGVTGISSVLGAVNLLATVFNMRVPGMTMFRLPLFTWGIIVTQTLILFAFPVFTAGAAMLFIERKFGGVFFDPTQGGNPILWQHMFWFFGHPEVYIVIMPAFGIISEVVPVFSRKPMFGYRAMVFAFFGIASLSFAVWAHHMFVTGAINLPWFSIMSFAIAVPTGIKFFNWIGTMWRGSISLASPMLFAVGFMFIFLIGGITGVFLASAPIDFAVTDTYYVVAHFHYVMLAGLEFALFAGLHYWIPKMSGHMLSEPLGKLSFWLLFVGFNTTFFPQFILGLEGMPRRIAQYSVAPQWQALNILSSVGAALLALSVIVFIWNVFTNVWLRRGRVAGDDPWGGNTLEWATSSPPPHHNFSSLPPIVSERPVFDMRHGLAHPGTGGATDPQSKPVRG